MEVTFPPAFVYIYTMKRIPLLIALVLLLSNNPLRCQPSKDQEALTYQLATMTLLKKSTLVSDSELLILLAKQSQIFAERYNFTNQIYSDLFEISYRAKKAQLYDSLLLANDKLTAEHARIKGDSLLNQYHGHIVASKKRKSVKNPIAVRLVHLGKSGKNMYSVGADGRLLRWNIATRTADVIYHNEKIDQVVKVSSDEHWIALATYENEIEILNLKDPTAEVTRIQSHKGSVVDLVFLPDNSGFISVGIDRQVLRFTLSDKKSTVLTNYDHPPTGMTISPDGELLAIGSRNGDIMLYDINSEDLNPRQLNRADISGKTLESMRFSKSGRILAIGGSDNVRGFGYVSLWDLEQEAYHGPELKGFTSGIMDMKFSADGKRLAIASRDNTARIWNVDGLYGFPIVLADHGGWVWSLDFDPKKPLLFTASADGLIRSFHLDFNTYLKGACDKVSRNLDEEEWKQYIGTFEQISFEETCPTPN